MVGPNNEQARIRVRSFPPNLHRRMTKRREQGKNRIAMLPGRLCHIRTQDLALKPRNCSNTIFTFDIQDEFLHYDTSIALRCARGTSVSCEEFLERLLFLVALLLLARSDFVELGINRCVLGHKLERA